MTRPVVWLLGVLAIGCAPPPVSGLPEQSPEPPVVSVSQDFGTRSQEPEAQSGSNRNGPATVTVALLDPARTRSGPARGCDTVVAVERPAEPGDNPAEAALRALFAMDDADADGLYNFIGRTGSSLRLTDVEVVDGTARVYLSGQLTNFAGACDHPRARIQIEETALRAPGVQQVEILLNGRVSDLQPDARGSR